MRGNHHAERDDYNVGGNAARKCPGRDGQPAGSRRPLAKTLDRSDGQALARSAPRHEDRRMTPPGDPRFREEWDLMHELRDAPQLLDLIGQSAGNELALQKQLRREYPDRLVRGAFALCELRKKGAAKFSRAADMWFDRLGLEQGTTEHVARHKANRFSGAAFDLCCGIGVDSLAP